MAPELFLSYLSRGRVPGEVEGWVCMLQYIIVWRCFKETWCCLQVRLQMWCVVNRMYSLGHGQQLKSFCSCERTVNQVGNWPNAPSIIQPDYSPHSLNSMYFNFVKRPLFYHKHCWSVQVTALDRHHCTKQSTQLHRTNYHTILTFYVYNYTYVCTCVRVMFSLLT